MSAEINFEHWRKVKASQQAWGFPWYLAWQFCQRFYSSHGIVPWVIDHDGMGYYGITLNQMTCEVHPDKPVTLGRMTITGDVENWSTGGPGDHSYGATKQLQQGVPTEQIVNCAIRHLNLPVIPAHSHANCRHKRWGKSYELCFEIAAIIAMQRNLEELEIMNHPAHTTEKIRELDPKFAMKYHPGAFLFRSGNNSCLLIGDGRLLNGTETNIWEKFMQGESITTLVNLILSNFT